MRRRVQSGARITFAHTSCCLNTPTWIAGSRRERVAMCPRARPVTDFEPTHRAHRLQPARARPSCRLKIRRRRRGQVSSYFHPAGRAEGRRQGSAGLDAVLPAATSCPSVPSAPCGGTCREPLSLSRAGTGKSSTRCAASWAWPFAITTNARWWITPGRHECQGGRYNTIPRRGDRYASVRSANTTSPSDAGCDGAHRIASRAPAIFRPIRPWRNCRKMRRAWEHERRGTARRATCRRG